MSIHDRIKKRRVELGMTQEDLAHKLGYKGKSIVSKVENGERDLRETSILIYANALKTTPAYLQGHADDPDLSQLDLEKIRQRAEDLKMKSRLKQNTREIRFKNAIASTLVNADPADIEAAGIDRQHIDAILEGDFPFTIDEAYDIAYKLGFSIDEVIGLNASIRCNDKVEEFIELFSQLTLEQQSLVILQMKGILSNRK